MQIKLWSEQQGVNRKNIPNGMYETYTFDVLSRPTHVRTYNRSNVLQDTKQYTWDAASRVTSATEGGVVAFNGYDLIDQLNSETKTALSYSATYTYDANGNRSSRTVNVGWAGCFVPHSCGKVVRQGTHNKVPSKPRVLSDSLDVSTLSGSTSVGGRAVVTTDLQGCPGRLEIREGTESRCVFLNNPATRLGDRCLHTVVSHVIAAREG